MGSDGHAHTAYVRPSDGRNGITKEGGQVLLLLTEKEGVLGCLLFSKMQGRVFATHAHAWGTYKSLRGWPAPTFAIWILTIPFSPFLFRFFVLFLITSFAASLRVGFTHLYAHTWTNDPPSPPFSELTSSTAHTSLVDSLRLFSSFIYSSYLAPPSLRPQCKSWHPLLPAFLQRLHRLLLILLDLSASPTQLRPSSDSSLSSRLTLPLFSHLLGCPKTRFAVPAVGVSRSRLHACLHGRSILHA